MVHQPRHILEAGVVEQQERLAGDTGTDETLADRGGVSDSAAAESAMCSSGDLQHVDVRDGELDEGTEQTGQQSRPWPMATLASS